MRRPSSSPPQRRRAAQRLRPKRALRARVAVALLLVIATGMACGCTSLRQWWRNGMKVGPNYARPPAPVAPAWVDSADPRVISEPAADCAWWTVFNDATL